MKNIKLIVGLGNPGDIYKNTNHNLGFLAIDYLVSFYKINFKYNKKFKSDMCFLFLKNKKILFLKPKTFMNNSGEAVYKIIKFYKINFKNLLVINDEIYFKKGIVKMCKNKNSAGHKGVQSIIDFLKTKKFYRIRIGIGKPFFSNSLNDFVLKKINKKIDLNEIFYKIKKFIVLFFSL